MNPNSCSLSLGSRLAMLCRSGFCQGVQVHVVSWALPPNMKYTKDENWCGQKDLIRLHALGPTLSKKGREDHLQGTSISHHGKMKIIFKSAF